VGGKQERRDRHAERLGAAADHWNRKICTAVACPQQDEIDHGMDRPPTSTNALFSPPMRRARPPARTAATCTMLLRLNLNRLPAA
jgi:hypothetical protein